MYPRQFCGVEAKAAACGSLLYRTEGGFEDGDVKQVFLCELRAADGFPDGYDAGGAGGQG